MTMNFVVKERPGTVLDPKSDPSRSCMKSTLAPRSNRKMLLQKRAANKPPSLIIKLKNERFITAKNQVETINKNNNVVKDPKKDDNDNFEQVIEVETFSHEQEDDCDVDEVPCESCIVEEVIVEHGCDDDVLVVKNPNAVFDSEDDGVNTSELPLTEVDLSSKRSQLIKDDVQVLEDHVLDLLEQFIQDNPEGHSLVKHDIEKNLFGDLDSYLGELMPRARDLDTLEKEVWDGMDIFDRVEEIEVEAHAQDLITASHNFHSGNLSRKARVKKACGGKVLYDCKSCQGVFMTMGELHYHQETVHEKVFSCGVCEKTFRKEAYLETHRDIHFCSNCGVYEKFKGTICDSCKGTKKKPLPSSKTPKKSLSTPMKSNLGSSNIWKKRAMTNLSRFLTKSRSFRNKSNIL